MKLNAQVRAKLVALLKSEALPGSQCGQAFLKLLAPLLQSGVLDWTRSGAGRSLAVKDAKALSEFCRLRFPEETTPAGVASRVAGLARFRDTKALLNDSAEIVSLRVWRDDVLLKNGKAVGAAAATAAHGVFSFLLTPDSPYELRGACALVENPAVFAAFEQLHLDVGAVIYGHGRISNRAVDWLARSGGADFKLVHLPDYDPVGLSEFQRLEFRLRSRVELHLPADLEALFDKFSNPELLRRGNSQVMLSQLRRSDLPAIRRVVGLIDRHNAGLEQEALLVPARYLL